MRTRTPLPRRERARALRALLKGSRESGGARPPPPRCRRGRPGVGGEKRGEPLSVPPAADRGELLEERSVERPDRGGDDALVVDQADVPEGHGEALGESELAGFAGIHRG